MSAAPTGPGRREPRPMRLTDRERCQLRAIQEALTADDPALAGLLSEGGPRPRRGARTVLVVVSTIGAFGLVLADSVLQKGGAVLLLVIPPAL